jgi:ribonuclease-3 family protein
MFEALVEGCISDFDIKSADVFNLHPLVLAYVGDAVYEAYIRTMLVTGKKANVHNLHKMSVQYVKAKAQADILHRINDRLTDEEQDVVRRGRNAKSASVPKNADVSDYRYSTAFESLIGYLYLMKSTPRLMEILKLCVVPEAND